MRQPALSEAPPSAEYEPGWTQLETTNVLIGTDLSRVPEIEDSIARFGDRYLARVYTSREIDECQTPHGAPDAQRLAARFSGKEAAIKALGIASDVALTDVEVATDSDGRPSLRFRGPCLRRLREIGGLSCAISLTHEGEFASATVVILASKSPPPTDIS